MGTVVRTISSATLQNRCTQTPPILPEILGSIQRLDEASRQQSGVLSSCDLERPQSCLLHCRSRRGECAQREFLEAPRVVTQRWNAAEAMRRLELPSVQIQAAWKLVGDRELANTKYHAHKERHV